jgi:glutamate dehydrogenase
MLNTDAVDNSGGVDMSDHEVNIKILLDPIVKKGVGLIKGRDERNRVLAEMTEEVAALVLKDNDNQARALTLDSLRSAARYEEFVAFIDDLAGTGVLDRADNAVPTRDELIASPHRKRGLPRPLLAVLLGHTKMWAFQTIMETGFPDSAAGRPFLDAYFPRRLRESFAEHFDSHFLKREIIATAAVNHLVNEAGITFLWRNMAATRTGIGEVLTAYVEVDREAKAEEARDLVEGAGLGAEKENALLLQIEEKLEALTRERVGGKQVDAARALEPIRAELAGQAALPAPAGNRA